VKIPPGVDTGTRIQLQGEGEIGPNGGPAGDLFVEIVVERHPIFERNGDELHCMVSVPMALAALGTSLDLETLDGAEKVTITAGTQPGHVVTLRGKGAARLRGGGRGDLYVHVNVQVPTNLSAEQQRMLQEFAGVTADQVSVGEQSAQSGGFFGKLKEAFTNK
jgi:molecular chaperone DnaJ